MIAKKTKVVLFCGGRGSKTLIHELLRRSDLDLTLIVNAYDDGLSTGAIRRFIPGMLGPSDFRKNLSYLLDLHSHGQYALQQLMEYRLPLTFSGEDLNLLREFCRNGQDSNLIPELRAFYAGLTSDKRFFVRDSLKSFFDYFEGHAEKNDFVFQDCSVGNLIFAGVYLNEGSNFNKAVRSLARIAGSQSHLVNISVGEGLTLVGLKSSGEVLLSEGAVVGEQSLEKIIDLFFLSTDSLNIFRELNFENLESKVSWLKSQNQVPKISDEARDAILNADVIIYGPGTQHSSLFPSYIISHDEIQESSARIKAYVLNLGVDHDIQGWSAPNLVDAALCYLSDVNNSNRSITHILSDSENRDPKVSRHFSNDEGETIEYMGAALVLGPFSNPIKHSIHNGYSIISEILRQFEISNFPNKPELDIIIDLQGRSVAGASIVQELSEIDWRTKFSLLKIHFINNDFDEDIDIGSNSIIKIFTTRTSPLVNEASAGDWFASWIRADIKANYLVVLTGDGEYRARNIIQAISLLEISNFGVVYGSRNQSRRQFLRSLRSAYGEGSFLFGLSWLGSLFLTGLFGLRFGVVLSDPLTGFRVYRKDRLNSLFRSKHLRSPKRSNIALTKNIIKSGIEIAEIPVVYKTHSGFTNPKLRFKKGLKDLFGFFYDL